jgi:polysaccharide export outer membrane protein
MGLAALLLVTALGQAALVPMDMVEVNVWRQPDLSGKFYVDPDTSVKLPLLGRIDLKNKVLDSLRLELFDRYRSYLGEAFITLNFYFRISVLGEVRRPGLYYVLSNDRIPSLLAQAEGTTERGNLRKVRVLRVGQEKKVDVQRILKEGRHLGELELAPGDLVIVPRRRTPSWQDIAVIVSTTSLALNIYVAFFK